jgi:Zn-finger in Ran binding protein and others
MYYLQTLLIYCMQYVYMYTQLDPFLMSAAAFGESDDLFDSSVSDGGHNPERQREVQAALFRMLAQDRLAATAAVAATTTSASSNTGSSSSSNATTGSAKAAAAAAPDNNSSSNSSSSSSDTANSTANSAAAGGVSQQQPRRKPEFRLSARAESIEIIEDFPSPLDRRSTVARVAAESAPVDLLGDQQQYQQQQQQQQQSSVSDAINEEEEVVFFTDTNDSTASSSSISNSTATATTAAAAASSSSAALSNDDVWLALSDWQCAACTLINTGGATECSVCGTPAPLLSGGSLPATKPVPERLS